MSGPKPDFTALLRFVRDPRLKINSAGNCLIAVTPDKAASMGYYDPNSPQEKKTDGRKL